MQPIVRHTGEVTLNSKIKFDNLELFNRVKASLAGKKFELVIKEKEESVSTESFGYYFGVVLKVAYNTIQYDSLDKSEDLHDKLFAPKFLTYEKPVRTANNKIITQKRVRSLTELNQKEMSQFIERVIADLELDGISVPRPEDVEIPKRYKTR